MRVWQPVSVLVRKYLEAKDDPEMLKTFTNTQLAETWVEKGEVPEYKRLYERREAYKTNELQPGAVFLTAATDVGKDYLKVEVVGWGRDKQSWSVDYRTIMGDTATDVPWLELDKILNESWKTAEGREIQLRMLLVDSGFNTQHVYKWVRKHPADRVRAIKGSDSLQMAFSAPRDIDVSSNGQKLKRASKVWPVGVSVIKSELYSWLTLDGAGDDGKFLPGFCHYPQYDEEFFKSLCSEQLMKRIVNGRTVYRWTKIHERNEALDCRVYNRAAAAMFGIDRFKSTDWDILEGVFDLPEVPKPKPEPTPTKPIQSDRIPNNGFMGRQNKKFW
jgi:phage terminase large subunit GpA-like protein